MPVPMHDRLRARMRQLGLSAAELARVCGVNRSFVYDILRGRSQAPNLEKLTRLAAALKVEVAWLLTGKGRIEGDDPVEEGYHDAFVAIRHVSARPAMGGGALIEAEAEAEQDFHFRRAWIRERLKTSPSMLRVMTVTGDSMEPTLMDGDRVLVDMQQCAPAPPGVFVLHDGLGLVAKRLEHIPLSDPPRLRILSDNPRYAPYECTAEEVTIIGRVRWCGREL